MIRIWIVFTSLKRRHYNKAILVWISHIFHWKTGFPNMYNLLYHMSTRLKTPTAQSGHKPIIVILSHNFQGKFKAFFQSQVKQMNFRSTFTPPKHFSFSQRQLKFLKLWCSILLTDLLTKITNNHSNSSLQFAKTKKNPSKLTVIMPEIYGKRKMKETILTLGL